MKYIDADKLIAEIERLKKENDGIRCKANGAYCIGYNDAFYDLLSTIDSLQQEQPEVDLEKDTIERTESHLESILLNFLDVDTVRWIIKDFKKAIEDK